MDTKRERLYQLHPELAIGQIDVLETLVKDFFVFLDYTEESDSGRIFHPIAISCCRALMIEPLSACLNKLRAAVFNEEAAFITDNEVLEPKKVINSTDHSMIDAKTAKRLIRICNRCGHAHAAISRNEANIFFEDFKSRFEQLDSQQKIENYGLNDVEQVPFIKIMESCHQCGNSHYDFHDKRSDEKLLDGITLKVIIKD
jgi:hypothetical protein